MGSSLSRAFLESDFKPLLCLIQSMVVDIKLQQMLEPVLRATCILWVISKQKNTTSSKKETLWKSWSYKVLWRSGTPRLQFFQQFRMAVTGSSLPCDKHSSTALSKQKRQNPMVDCSKCLQYLLEACFQEAEVPTAHGHAHKVMFEGIGPDLLSPGIQGVHLKFQWTKICCFYYCYNKLQIWLKDTSNYQKIVSDTPPG